MHSVMYSFLLSSLNSFSTAAGTNHPKLSSLTQHKRTILKFRRSEVQKQSRWAKVQVSAGLVPWGERRICSSPFTASRRHLYSLAHGPSTHHSNLLLPSSPLLLTMILLLLTFKDPLGYPDIQDNLPMRKFLI